MKDRSEFDQMLLHSGMLHWRIDPDHRDSLEYRMLQKPVTKQKALWDGQDLSCWMQEGDGSLSVSDDSTLCL